MPLPRPGTRHGADRHPRSHQHHHRSRHQQRRRRTAMTRLAHTPRFIRNHTARRPRGNVRFHQRRTQIENLRRRQQNHHRHRRHQSIANLLVRLRVPARPLLRSASVRLSPATHRNSTRNLPHHHRNLRALTPVTAHHPEYLRARHRHQDEATQNDSGHPGAQAAEYPPIPTMCNPPFFHQPLWPQCPCATPVGVPPGGWDHTRECPDAGL